MRVIKFRVWSKKNKKMYYPSEGKERGIDYQVSFWLGGWELVEITAEKGGVVVCGKDDTITGTRDDGELMQYTGLKDKNGKDIYEGDIVKFRSHPDKTKVGEISWSEQRSGWCFLGETVTSITGRTTREYIGLSHITSIEVIGNIYENKDLLV